MNYAHAFHAGNFADVLKHVVLTRILLYLTRKPAPFRVIDTHAGEGVYALDRAESERSGEWRDGVGRFFQAEREKFISPQAKAYLTPYLEAVGASDAQGRPYYYPGSPALAQSFLRDSDRAMLCEKHPAAFAALQRCFAKDKRVKTFEMDGWQGLKAFTPPPEKRGLILIDPPFEQADEFAQMAKHFQEAYRKWPTGVYMVWHPMKAHAPVAAFLEAVQQTGAQKFLRLELTVDAYKQAGLTRSGVLIVNPPHVLAQEAQDFLPSLARLLEKTPGAGAFLIEERS